MYGYLNVQGWSVMQLKNIRRNSRNKNSYPANHQVELPVRTGVCAVATQGSALYDTDYVTKYEIQTSLDKENWVTYQENGTDKVN